MFFTFSLFLWNILLLNFELLKLDDGVSRKTKFGRRIIFKLDCKKLGHVKILRIVSDQNLHIHALLLIFGFSLSKGQTRYSLAQCLDSMMDLLQ